MRSGTKEIKGLQIMQTAVASPRLGGDRRGADVHRLPWEMMSLQNQKVRQQPAWPKRRRLGMGQVASKALRWGCQGLKKRGVAVGGGWGVSCSAGQAAAAPGNPHQEIGFGEAFTEAWGERPGPCYKHETGLWGSEAGTEVGQWAVLRPGVTALRTGSGPSPWGSPAHQGPYASSVCQLQGRCVYHPSRGCASGIKAARALTISTDCS